MRKSARLPLRLAPSGFWSGGTVRHALCARMGERWMGSHARRFNQRSVRAATRRSRRGRVRLRWFESIDVNTEKRSFSLRVVWTVVSNLLLLQSGVRSYATGGCCAIYRQPTADAAFYCATQYYSAEST